MASINFGIVVYPQQFQYKGLVEPITPPGEEAEKVRMDKWFVRTSEPRWDVQRNQYLYPSFFAPSETVALDAIKGLLLAKGPWRPTFPDYIWDIERTQYTYPFFFKHPRTVVEFTIKTSGSERVQSLLGSKDLLIPTGKFVKDIKIGDFSS